MHFALVPRASARPHLGTGPHWRGPCARRRSVHDRYRYEDCARRSRRLGALC
jgi:hypothetical protein